MNSQKKPASGGGRLRWNPDARRSAVALLVKLSQGRRNLEALLEELDRSGIIRDPRDRDLLQALVFGVLRWQGRLDFILSRFSNIPLARIEPAVLAILRLALFQIMFLTRIPPPAAVHSAVETARVMAGPWVAPFVNAVLRRAALGHSTVVFPDRNALPVPALAAEWSCPEWLVARWVGRYGVETAADLCEAINRLPPLTLRANTLKTSRGDLAAAMHSFTTETAASGTAPDAVRVSGLKMPIGGLEVFRQGWFQVQDEAAQLVSLLLDPQPGETVLDACAGRGGKTGHVAQLMQDRGQVVALDQNASRLAQLMDEMSRLGASIVSVCEADLTQPGNWERLGPFDRILLDAPCSGLGTLRRNPDIKWSAHKRDLNRYRDIQIRLLERASTRLKPQGVIVYAVCSPEPEETVDVVEAFISKKPEFRIDRAAGGLPEAIRPLIDAHGFLQTYPRLSYMDGFFAVRFRYQS
ncbi:MAG: 16S rRNA (cytosine(967)-C(5))-methyltransferase RsmB [Desulfobacterales bacterium]|nr:16S rRNA (cytosine(967)-C(5))-methyltransferase RsmB [Desulfobacterales bacterium]